MGLKDQWTKGPKDEELKHRTTGQPSEVNRVQTRWPLGKQVAAATN